MHFRPCPQLEHNRGLNILFICMVMQHHMQIQYYCETFDLQIRLFKLSRQRTGQDQE